MMEVNWEMSQESMNFSSSLTFDIPDSEVNDSTNNVIRRKDYVFERIELNDKLSELMKCKSCNLHFNHNPNSKMVRMCDGGHFFCNSPGCGPRCPTWENGQVCHKYITRRQFPFYFHLYDSGIFSCQFKIQGCPEILTGPQLLDHEKSCYYDPFFSCFYKLCRRNYMPFSELIEHLKKGHDAMVTKKSFADISVPSFLEQETNGEYYAYFIPMIFSFADDLNLALVLERWSDTIQFSVLLMNRIALTNKKKLTSVQCNIEKNNRIHPWITQPILSSSDRKSGFSMTVSQFQDKYVTKARCKGGKDFFKFQMYLRYK